MKYWFFIACFFLKPTIAVCTAATKESSGPVAVVHQLYHDFAWEAVIWEPKETGLLEQPRPVLERYFDSKLTDLILQDRECVARTKEICKLDFLPQWASQDPGASDMKITSGQGNTVNVEFRYPGNGSTVKILYQTIKTSGHWRISDIRSEVSSLLSILESK